MKTPTVEELKHGDERLWKTDLPTVSLAEYSALRCLPKWLAAALRTECPIEQHMRHGRSTIRSTQAEYEAHVDGHRKTATDWDALVTKIKGAV